MAPGVLAAARVIFVPAVSEFGVPGLLRVLVHTTEVMFLLAYLARVVPVAALALAASTRNGPVSPGFTGR